MNEEKKNIEILHLKNISHVYDQDYQKIKTRKKSGQDYQDDDKKPFGNIIYHMTGSRVM